jgi:hypothetical protein
MNTLIITNFEKLIKETNYVINYIKTKENMEDVVGSLGYKLKAFHKSLDLIKSYNYKIKTGEQLKGIKGIGNGTINRINYILTYGSYESEFSTDIVKSAYEYNSKQVIEQNKILDPTKLSVQEIVKKYPCAIKSKTSTNLDLDILTDDNQINKEPVSASLPKEDQKQDEIGEKSQEDQKSDENSFMYGCLGNTLQTIQNWKNILCNYQTDIYNFS